MTVLPWVWVLRVIFNDNGPTSQRKYTKRGLRRKVKIQRGAFVERPNNKRDLRVVYNGNPGQIPDLICHRIIKKNRKAYAYGYEIIYDIYCLWLYMLVKECVLIFVCVELKVRFIYTELRLI